MGNELSFMPDPVHDFRRYENAADHYQCEVFPVFDNGESPNVPWFKFPFLPAAEFLEPHQNDILIRCVHKTQESQMDRTHPIKGEAYVQWLKDKVQEFGEPEEIKQANVLAIPMALALMGGILTFLGLEVMRRNPEVKAKLKNLFSRSDPIGYCQPKEYVRPGNPDHKIKGESQRGNPRNEAPNQWKSPQDLLIESQPEEEHRTRCPDINLPKLNTRNGIFFPPLVESKFRGIQGSVKLGNALLDVPVKIRMVQRDGQEVDVGFVEMSWGDFLQQYDDQGLDRRDLGLAAYNFEDKPNYSLVVAISCGKIQGFMFGKSFKTRFRTWEWVASRMMNLYKGSSKGLRNLGSAFHVIRLLGLDYKYANIINQKGRHDTVISSIMSSLLAHYRYKFETREYGTLNINGPEFKEQLSNISLVDLR